MRPTAAPARFPYAEHRTMAEVIECEADEREDRSHVFLMKQGSVRLAAAIQRARAA